MYKILIVEDDEVIGRTVQRHLQEWGYEAVCVNDLKHVLEEFAALVTISTKSLVLPDPLFPTMSLIIIGTSIFPKQKACFIYSGGAGAAA